MVMDPSGRRFGGAKDPVHDRDRVFLRLMGSEMDLTGFQFPESPGASTHTTPYRLCFRGVILSRNTVIVVLGGGIAGRLLLYQYTFVVVVDRACGGETTRERAVRERAGLEQQLRLNRRSIAQSKRDSTTRPPCRTAYLAGCLRSITICYTAPFSAFILCK